MNSSIRNSIRGTIVSIKSDTVMSELVIDTPVGGIVSVVTTSSVGSLGLAAGDAVCAVFKATNVSVNKCQDESCGCGNH